MKMSTWVVTGAAGYLGSYVVEQLLSHGIKVVGVDDFSTGREAYLACHANNSNFVSSRVDIRDVDSLTSLFRQHQPEAVVHLAALHFIPACIANPTCTVSVNILGTQSVLSAARSSNIGRLSFASTGDVYAASDAPHNEVRSAIAPFNIYGLSKWICEQLIALESRDRPEARFAICRLFNLYGPRETNPHFLPEVLQQLRDRPGQALRLGSLWPKRDLVPVSDAARAFIDILAKVEPGVTTVNVASGVARSMQDVLGVIGELRGKPVPIETDPSKIRPVERPHLQADVDNLRQLIGWTPHTDLRKGLREMLLAEGLMSSELLAN